MIVNIVTTYYVLYQHFLENFTGLNFLDFFYRTLITGFIRKKSRLYIIYFTVVAAVNPTGNETSNRIRNNCSGG